MKYLYCKENQVKKYEIIENFPNPYFKKVLYKNEICTLHIIANDIENTIRIKELTKDEINWYCPQMVNKNERIIMFGFEWFPKELIAGVIDGRYNPKHKLSLSTGYIQSVNSGSHNECFILSKFNEVIKILINHRFLSKDFDLKKFL
jgi:hypothetical protein